MIKEHDLVILKSRVGNIFSNSIGTVVYIYTDKEFEVEFTGEDAAVLHVFDYQIQKFK